MKDVNSLVDRWFDILGYNENESKITLYFDSGRNSASEANRLLSRMRKEYDSDILTFCVLRYAMEAHKKVRLTVEEALSSQFAEMAAFMKMIETSPLNDKIREVRQALEKFIARPDLIGSVSDLELCERISEVGPLNNLHYECMQTSGKPFGKITRISKEVLVESSLGELLLKAASMPDGMVLGYIQREKDCEGFFSLMAKSNGNIISVNDRPTEEYFGQFGVLGRRNNRYAEYKAFSVFPYDSVLDLTFSASGVHDIIDTATVRKEKMSFDDFSVEEAFRFFLGCLLIESRLIGKTCPEEKLTLTTGLMKDNIPLLESKALITADNRSLVQGYNTIRFEIPAERIIGAPLGGEDTTHRLYGHNTSATLFREWFEPGMAELMDDYSDLLPVIRKQYGNEFLSTKKHIEDAMVLYVRTQLKEKIQDRINTYFKDHSKGEEAIKAYQDLILAGKDGILERLKDRLSNPECWENKNVEVYYYEGKQNFARDVGFMPFNDLSQVVRENFKSSSWRGHAYLRDSGGKCNMVYSCVPRTVDDICRILDVTQDELPKEMRGWQYNGNDRIGNNLLNITDPLTELQNGFYADCRWFNPFSFSIAMSRKNWKARFGARSTERHGKDGGEQT